MRALLVVFPTLNRKESCSLLPRPHTKTQPDASALLIIADEVGKRSPLAETGSAGLLAIVGLRLDFLDLVGHGVEEMGEKGGDEEADRACSLLYTFAPAYDARCALSRLIHTRHIRVRSHNRPSRAHRLRVRHEFPATSFAQTVTVLALLRHRTNHGFVPKKI